ncbi:matE family protein [Nocardiopsis sp. MG754419]|uniref:matE family protein n=1 Tax=Nocardiopsis sp. MG754419 TaxID=2259865 RepID=UPI001BA49943|nr:matE family protein [Nocardiopsis sp. MG754419]MBR8740640.1 matE family protein [Nocardiopsis sp. MG754419]
MSWHTDPTPADPPSTRHRSPSVLDLLRGAVPLYLSMVASLVGTAVVALVLAHSHTTALAAHALVTAVLAPAILAGQGALRGTMPFVARAEGDPEALGAVVRDGAWLALLFGSVSAVAVASVPLWAGAAGVAAPIRAALGPYPWFVTSYALLATLGASVTTLLVALGRNRAVLGSSLVHTALSILLVPVLVTGPGPLPALGLTGAGIALVVDGAAVLALKVFLVRRSPEFRARGWCGPPRPRRMWSVLRVGLPSGASLLVKSLALGVLGVVVARSGPAEAVAHQFLLLTGTLLFFPALAVGQSAIPLMAVADPHRARRVLLTGYVLALPVTLASLALVWSQHPRIAVMVSPDPAVGALMAAAPPCLVWVASADNVQVIAGMGLIALRRTAPTLVAFGIGYGSLAVASEPLVRAGGVTLLWVGYGVAVTGLALGQVVAFLRAAPRPAGDG